MFGSNALKAYGRGICANCRVVVAGACAVDSVKINEVPTATAAEALTESLINFLLVVLIFSIGLVESRKIT